MRTFRQRLPYAAIVDRPKLALPGGARVAVWVIVNVEEWSDERAMPRTVLPPPSSGNAGQPLLPDLPNWAWHEYGMRVGFWRFLDCLKALDIRATLAINGSVCRTYPRVAKAALDAGWEFMRRSTSWRARESSMWPTGCWTTCRAASAPGTATCIPSLIPSR
jgi:allantoinase